MPLTEFNTKLQVHINRYSKCISCPLGKISKTKVFYRGSVPCDVLFVGEAPGDTELALGEPFLGPSGNLLNEIIAESLNVKYSTCFTNTVLCTPADSPSAKLRAPKKAEVSACSNRLFQFIDIVEPKYIIAVGRVAESSLKKLNLTYDYIPHPSSILKQEERGNLDRARACRTLSKIGNVQ